MVVFGRRGNETVDCDLLSMKPIAAAVESKLGQTVTFVEEENMREVLSSGKEQEGSGCKVFLLENIAVSKDMASFYSCISEFADV